MLGRMAMTGGSVTRLVASGCVVLAAVAVGLLPPSSATIEALYAGRFGAIAQPMITAVVNALPFPLYDTGIILLAGLALFWIVLAIARPRQHLVKSIVRMGTTAAAVYLAAMVLGGLSFRRAALSARPTFDESRVTYARVQALGDRAADELNALYPRLPNTWPDWSDLAVEIAPAFDSARQSIGLEWKPALARPKGSLTEIFLRAAGFNGVTTPVSLEVLVNHRLLGFERPYVLAHEWAHQATMRGNESEAAYIGWLACMHGPEWAQYSAWLRIYQYAIGDLDPPDQKTLSARLGKGPHADLIASAQRVARDFRPAAAKVNDAGTRVMAAVSRMPAGTRNYSLVVRLILGMTDSVAVAR